MLTSSGWDNAIRQWDAATSTCLQVIGDREHPDSPLWGLAWSPDGKLLACATVSRGLLLWEVGADSLRWIGRDMPVWDASTGACLYTLNEPSGSVYALAWNLGGAGLLSGGSDGRLRWWDVHSGQCIRVREAHQGTVQALKVSPDGRKLASCGDDGAIMLWDLESGDHLRTLRPDRPYERMNISGVQGLTEAQKASLRALGAVEEGVFAP